MISLWVFDGELMLISGVSVGCTGMQTRHSRLLALAAKKDTRISALV